MFFFFQAEDGIRDLTVTGVQTCALPICGEPEPDPLAGATGTDALADGIDHACPVVMRYLEAVDRPGRRAAARLPVGRVDAGQPDLDPHLAGARFGPLDVGDPEHLVRVPVAVVERSSHSRLPRL